MVSETRKREGPQLLLRFAEGSDLRDRLNAIAAANNRSLTAEILHRLEQSFSDLSDSPSMKLLLRGKGRAGADLEQRLTRLEKKVADLQVPDFANGILLEETDANGNVRVVVWKVKPNE